MDYMDELRFSVKYPFTSLARELVARMNISFDALDPVFIERARQRIMEDVKGGVNLNPNARLTKALEAELVSYPLAKILVSLSKSPYLKRQFVSGEANTLRRFLMVEDEDAVERVARELGLDARGDKLHFKSYLKFLPKDDNYKLVYQELKDGYVSITRDTLVEIIVSAFTRQLNKDLETYPADLEFLKKHLEGLGIERTEAFEYSGPMDADAFPPCMKKILADAAAGVHLGHNARFAIATFLANVGLAKEKIVDVFRNQPNFNERLTTYHVEYILGERGSGQKRMTPSCEKMKIYGLCVNPDQLCQRIKNPLGYYRVKLRSRRRRHESKEVAKR